MYITDNEGKKLEVTDLERAIAQAEAFQDYQHVDPQYKGLDKRLKEYWSDVYKKLITLKTNK